MLVVLYLVYVCGSPKHYFIEITLLQSGFLLLILEHGNTRGDISLVVALSMLIRFCNTIPWRGTSDGGLET